MRNANLGLGTVQFGLDYGIANHEGQCTPNEAAEILHLAARAAIEIVDTAALYGSSEAVIGRNLPVDGKFKLITKTASFGGQRIGQKEISELVATFERSLERLKLESVYGLLVHHCEDLTAPGGERILETMQEFVAAGRVQKIGASVYQDEQLAYVLDNPCIEIIQVPLNVLDQRHLQSGDIQRLSAAGIEVHVRSAFLQGLLLTPVDTIPDFLGPLCPVLSEYYDWLTEQGLSALEGALGFIRQVDGVACVVVGVCSRSQFNEVLTAYGNVADCSLNFDRFAVADESLIDPRHWAAP